jgi:hypothetical protein
MAPKSDCRRRPRIVDRPLQLALLWKAIVQWLLFTTVAFGVLLAWSFLGQPTGQGHLQAIWDRHGVVFVVLAALLPVVVYDSFRFSHRLAGPMVRLRYTLHRLAKGEQVERLKFRRRDYWHDVADDFNVLLDRLENGSPSERGEEPRAAISETVGCAQGDGGQPWRRPRSGVAAAELAVCLPILLLFIIGAVECCSMIYVDQTLAIASYEGVRAGIRFDATNADVEDKCQALLDARRVRGATIVIDPPDVAQTPRGSPISVTVSAPCSENNVLATWFFTDKSLTQTSKMVKE